MKKSLSLSDNKLGGHRVLELKNIVKKYNTGGSKVAVLKSVNIHFRENEFVSILLKSLKIEIGIVIEMGL